MAQKVLGAQHENSQGLRGYGPAGRGRLLIDVRPALRSDGEAVTLCDLCNTPRQELKNFRLVDCQDCKSMAKAHPEIFTWISGVAAALRAKFSEDLDEHKRDFKHSRMRPW